MLIFFGGLQAVVGEVLAYPHCQSEQTVKSDPGLLAARARDWGLVFFRISYVLSGLRTLEDPWEGSLSC